MGTPSHPRHGPQIEIEANTQPDPAPGEMYKEVPSEGDVVCGHHLPGGTWVGVNYHSIMRRKDLWGEDSRVFRPERWLEAAAEDDEKIRLMINTFDHVFGSGKFQCLGKPFAWMEMNKALVEVRSPPLFPVESA